jgi:hypothetical protein
MAQWGNVTFEDENENEDEDEDEDENGEERVG